MQPIEFKKLEVRWVADFKIISADLVWAGINPVLNSHAYNALELKAKHWNIARVIRNPVDKKVVKISLYPR